MQDALLAARAREKNTQLYISHLKQAVSFADGGKGVRWLINVLQIADIQREDYDPNIYTIKVVGSKEDLVKGDQGLASVVLPPNTVFDTKTGKITMKKTQVKGIYNALSSGRNGVQIVCTDKNLKTHLEKQIAAVKSRQAWMRTYVGKLSDTKNISEESMVRLPGDHADKIREADSGYSKKIKDDYRNRSAHAEAVSIVDARECIEYVITLSRKLGVLLDQYRF